MSNWGSKVCLRFLDSVSESSNFDYTDLSNLSFAELLACTRTLQAENSHLQALICRLLTKNERLRCQLGCIDIFCSCRWCHSERSVAKSRNPRILPVGAKIAAERLCLAHKTKESLQRSHRIQNGASVLIRSLSIQLRKICAGCKHIKHSIHAPKFQKGLSVYAQSTMCSQSRISTDKPVPGK